VISVCIFMFICTCVFTVHLLCTDEYITNSSHCSVCGCVRVGMQGTSFVQGICQH